MSWESLPEEIHVQILAKLSYSSLEVCRLVSRGLKKIVETNRRRLQRRQINLVRLCCEEEEWSAVVFNKDERKRKIFREEPDWKRGFDTSPSTSSSPENLLHQIQHLIRDSTIRSLEFYEVALSSDLISHLITVFDGVAVETVDISMSSFGNMDGKDLLRFLVHVKPKNVRLSWIRHLPAQFFHLKELIDYLQERDTLELVNLTDHQGKQVDIPLKVTDLLKCYSFHVDESCQLSFEDISTMTDRMQKGVGPHHVRLECSARPKLAEGSQLIARYDSRGFSVKRPK